RDGSAGGTPMPGMDGGMPMPAQDPMAGMGMQPATPAEPAKDSDKDKAKEKGKATDGEPEKVSPLSLQGFHQLLAARVRIGREQQAKDAELLAALGELEKAAEALSVALNESHELTYRRYAAASDLKKRVGRGELKSDEAPAELTQALNGDDLNALEAEAAALVVVKAETRKDADTKGKADPARRALDAGLEEALGLASQRLALLLDLARLEREQQREKKDLPESEVARIKQEANERMAKESSWLETLAGVDSSPSAKALVE